MITVNVTALRQPAPGIPRQVRAGERSPSPRAAGRGPHRPTRDSAARAQQALKRSGDHARSATLSLQPAKTMGGRPVILLDTCA